MSAWKLRDISELKWTTWPEKPDAHVTFCVECQQFLVYASSRVPVALVCFRCGIEYCKLEPGIYG